MNPQADQTRLQSLYSLKTILVTGDTIERLLPYCTVVDQTFARANQLEGPMIKRLALAMEAIAAREEDILAFNEELLQHLSSIDQLIESRKLDSLVSNVAKKRLDLEKSLLDVLDVFTSSSRGFSSAYQNFSIMCNNIIDLLDQDHVSLLEQTYVASVSQLEKIRISCNDLAKRYGASPVLAKIFNTFGNFSQNLFQNLGINAEELIAEVNTLKEFNNAFHPLEKVFEKARVEIENNKNEAAVTRCLQEFGDLFSRLSYEVKNFNTDPNFMKKFFTGHNLQELRDGYDYMLMVKEIFGAFSKILDQRVRNGFAEEGAYRELDNVLNDKPDNLVNLSSMFRNNFS